MFVEMLFLSLTLSNSHSHTHPPALPHAAQLASELSALADLTSLSYPSLAVSVEDASDTSGLCSASSSVKYLLVSHQSISQCISQSVISASVHQSVISASVHQSVISASVHQSVISE